MTLQSSLPFVPTRPRAVTRLQKSVGRPERPVRKFRAGWFATWLALFTLPLISFNAAAVPSMARQTGMQCSGCHTVFPELTPFGRQFKLRAYSMSTPKADDASILDRIPVSALLQISRTSTAKTDTPEAMPDSFPRDRQTIVQAAGLYYGGKITDQSGALIQYNYDGIERRWGMEMFDARYAGTTTLGKELIYGVTLNNNPTVSDIYNSTPAWGFPHTGSAGLMPASTLVDMTLASQVGGVGAYGLWDNLVYAEFALYRTARKGILRPLAAGVPTESVIAGYAPYWRLALQKELGPHSVSVGTYGLIGKVYSDRSDFSLGADRFKDIAVDGQYQFIDGDHTLSTHATWIREKQAWNSSFAQGLTSSSSATLKTFKTDVHYWFKRQWGGGLQYFDVRGSADDLRYNTGEAVMGSANGSPNSKGYIAELNYLPWQNTKLALRYTAYRQFNGASDNYDGFGRNAKDNNSVYFLGWFLF